MIRVAIADDSRFTCGVVASYLQEGGECQVVGFAHDAAATLDIVRREEPHVLTLDLQMPGGDGLDLLRQIAAESRTAVVVVSGVTRSAAATTLRALELGAVDFVLKYTPGAPVSRASLRREIVSKVKVAAASRAAFRPIAAPSSFDLPAARPLARAVPRPAAALSEGGLVVIGASTGGPGAIAELMAELPEDFSKPCVIVQHLPAMFTAPFAAQLGRQARIPVAEAVSGDRLEGGRAYVTPGSSHIVIGADGGIELAPPLESDLYRPSIDRAMTSAAKAFGSSAVAVILTGMGDDGAEGAKAIRCAGGEAYVQEPASCVIASMPMRTLERAGADHVARPRQIGRLLARVQS
ncbi:MAG TPA: chemotaxis-specific protein-glutamate methyltransferase CheB [Vicinamibacterales bacterium]|nr:chemotaxis-specific protein-glutamate methyltransferase CheB [Vicinamibacterales bacterium]